MPGRHNRENAAAATAAARALGVPDERIALALATFPGVPHRLEFVGEHRGVRFVNDSKATNVAAALRALDAYAGDPVRLIAGGSRKGEDLAPLAAGIGANVRAAYLIGETAEELAALLAVPSYRVNTLERAVEQAYAEAEPGDVVLLTPAAASFDQFRDFEHRGEDFRRLVANLEG
jgi:UDP-N-acetylmuramoylalanine--D-glutamate ligase